MLFAAENDYLSFHSVLNLRFSTAHTKILIQDMTKQIDQTFEFELITVNGLGKIIQHEKKKHFIK